MKRNKVLGVALVGALSGSLLVGCTSDSADTTTSATPSATTPASAATTSAYPLVGTSWRAEDGGGRPQSCDGPGEKPGMYGGLFLRADGAWVIPWCNSSWGGTYEVNGDTITWVGGSDCDAGVKGVYKFTLDSNQFNQVVIDDPCEARKNAFNGVTYTAPAETTSPSPSPS